MARISLIHLNLANDLKKKGCKVKDTKHGIKVTSEDGTALSPESIEGIKEFERTRTNLTIVIEGSLE